ncbi:MAG TPA: hypothetical protein VGJ20_37295 [Xanthobacteraceae bacterium]
MHSYLNTAIVHHEDSAYAKWIAPVCPLVAGLSKAQGEFVLARISSIAGAAGVPLDSEKCNANLLVIVTNDPDRQVRTWVRVDPTRFADAHGSQALKRFVNTPRAVRVWYNAEFRTGFGNAPLTMVAMGAGTAVPFNYQARPTHLKFDSVRAIVSAIIIVDRNQVTHVNFGQLFDFVTMLALAEIDQDKDHTEAPTILNLFTDSARAPAEGMSSWDEAFLKALYQTSQESRMQLSEMTTSMTKSLEHK